MVHRTLNPLPTITAISPISEGAVSTTPMFSLAINPIVRQPSSVTRNNITGVAQYLGGLEYFAQYNSASTIPTTNPAFTSIMGPPANISQIGMGLATLGGGSTHSQDDPLPFRPLHFGPDTGQTTPILEQVAGVSTASPRISDPPPGPSDPPLQRAAASEPNSHTSLMNVGHLPLGGTSTPPVTASSAEPPPAPRRLDQSHTYEPLLSPTTPTPVDRGRQRLRSRPNTLSQEIPQMLGEMKNVIVNLATSVNGLKDAVSDLRSQ